MHRAFVSDVFYNSSYDRLSIRAYASRLTSLAVGLLLVLHCTPTFSAIFRVVWKKLTFVPIRETVIQAAGIGTRELPATKAIQMELLLVYDRRFIGHLVEEDTAAGITEIRLITRRGKEAI
jgi:hypothetical protein